MRILMAGGGTGGHLFPAIAIAQEFERLDQDCRIEMVGTRYGIEYTMRDNIKYPLSFIAVRGLPRKISLGLISFPFRLLWAIWQTLRLFRRFRPDLVVGTGGYVAGPVMIAAALKKIPRALQEQNSYPGLMTRRLARLADVIFIAYRRAKDYLPPDAITEMLGNPIRREITGGDRSRALTELGLKPDRKTILILGGSQGARRLNKAVLAGIDRLDDRVQLLWQCGKRDYKDVLARLDKKDFVISLFPFLNNMEMVYAAADLAIARAGALTIAELTACSVPSLLVPFPYATADHQRYNAEEVAESGAAEMILESDLDKIDLMEKAVNLVTSSQLETMKLAARRVGKPQAAADIAARLMALVGDKGVHIDNKDYTGAG